MTDEKTEEKKPAEIKKAEEKFGFLDKAEEIAKRNEAAVEAMSKLVQRNEELAARNLLGGKTDAGVQPQPVVETPAEYAKRIMGGK